MNQNTFFIFSLILYSSSLFAVESNVRKQSDNNNGHQNPIQKRVSIDAIQEYSNLLSNV